MIDTQTIAAIVFLIALAIFVFLKRKSLETKQIIPYFLYFSMYRTKIGLRFMDFFAERYKRLVIYIGYFGIFIGFLGMILISYGLINNIYLLFTRPEATSGVGLVLPFKGKGIFYVPFLYWIISIFFILIVHEFSHGLVARANKIKVKSSGLVFFGTGFRVAGLATIAISYYFKISNHGSFRKFDFFNYSSPDFWLIVGFILVLISFIKNFSLFGYIPIIPGAFVEPDENQLKKKRRKEQLSVFAAGPLANIAFAFLFIAIASFILAPMANAAFEPNGVKVTDYVKGKDKTMFPAEISGLKIGETIQKIDDKDVAYVENLSTTLRSKKPNEIVKIKTDKSTYEIRLAKNPDNESLAYMGAYLEQSTKIKDNVKAKYGEFIPNSLIWVYGLVFWLYVLNFGIGLFNLVPIGPLDGGRMMQVAMHKIFDKEKGDRYWHYIGIFFLILIFINVAAGFVK